MGGQWPPPFYVEYGMKMAFTVYLHMICVHRARAVYNVVHLFLVYLTDKYFPRISAA